MELELYWWNRIGACYCNYIIPIWNWSSGVLAVVMLNKIITLFLYGIGATSVKVIWIFPSSLHYSYMELEQRYRFEHSTIDTITLFLYGIGAFYTHCFFSSSYLLHYSYMELEPFTYNPILNPRSELHYSYMELELCVLFRRL